MSALPQRSFAQFRPLIRRARLGDLNHILEIERASFKEPWDADTIVQSIGWFPTTCFVAEWGGKVIGFLIGTPRPVEEGFFGHICNLAVAEEFRSKGIGSLLLKRAEHQFMVEGALGMQLEVRESNNLARTFYQQRGYVEVVTVPHYYTNDESAMVMMKCFRY